MKRFFQLLMIGFLVWGCRNGKAPEPVGKTVVAADTACVETPDTLAAADSAETAPPPTVDEFFADFIYSYSTNRGFQMSRTDFPLAEYVDGKRDGSIGRGRWKFDRLYYGRSFHVVILDSEQSLADIKDMKTDTVRVDRLMLDSMRCRQYVFVRNKGLWRLERIHNFDINRHRDADFLQFYGKFATDSVCQRERLAETIEFATYNEDDRYNEIEGTIEKDQWPAFHPELPAEDLFSVDYGLTRGDGNVRVLAVSGNSNGMSTMFKFVRRHGGWTLVKFAS